MTKMMSYSAWMLGQRGPWLALALVLLLTGCSGSGGGGGSSDSSSDECVVTFDTEPAAQVTPLEGSTVSPQPLAENSPYSGQVDTTVSYYSFTTTAASASYAITLSGMTDDVDLYYYDTDSNYTTASCKPLYGRKTTETCATATLSSSTTIYLAVKGNYTTAGADYSLLVKQPSMAESSSPPAADQGSVGAPVPISTGVLNTATVDDSTGGANGGYSYYVASVTAGQQYGVALSSLDDNLALDVFDADSSFTTAVCSSDQSGMTSEGCTLTASGSSLYIRVDGSGTTDGDVYGLSVVQPLGDNCDPLATFVDKTYFDEGSTASGSRFALSVTSGQSYAGCIRSDPGADADGDDVTLRLFNASAGLEGTAACTATSLSNASSYSLCGPVTADGSTLYAQVTTPNQSGGALFSWQVMAGASDCTALGGR